MSIYAKFITDILKEPKFLTAGPEASWMWFLGVLWSKDAETEGFVPDSAIPLISIGQKQPKKLAQKLVDAELWKRVPGGYALGDDSRGLDKWSKWQTPQSQIDAKRAADAERQRLHRARLKAEEESHESRQVTPAIGVTVTRDIVVTERDMSLDDACDTSHDVTPRPLHARASPEPRAQSPEKIVVNEGLSEREGRARLAVDSSSSPPNRNLIPPERQWVVDRCIEIGLPVTEVDGFMSYHEARGWRFKNGPMRSWQGALGTWRSQYQKGVFEGQQSKKGKSMEDTKGGVMALLEQKK